MNQISGLAVRCATAADLKAVCRLTDKAYPVQGGYSVDELHGHINSFPEGTFVAESAGRLLGYCASIRLPEARVLTPHSWAQITANGYGSTHEPAGDYLYGFEICVDPDFRRLHIAHRLYQERFALCVKLKLEGIAFGGRLPGLRRRLESAGNAAAYVQKVVRRQWRDPVLTFQLNNGFHVIGILSDYMPDDYSSMGYAAHLLWRNSEHHHLHPDADKGPM